MPRLFISTGEVSGDLQGALLIAALQRQAAQRGITLEILGLGGDRMAAAGAHLLSNTSGIGSVGLIEALGFIWPTLRLQRRTYRYLRQHPPDLVVLIDYLSGNVPLGSFIRRHFDVPIIYYIAPQEWVWSISPRATQKIIELSDRLLAIFPEEARYYTAHGGNVAWVGHPLVDRMATAPDRQTARQQLGLLPDQVAIALFPASRQQEIKSLLPIIFAAARQIQDQLSQSYFYIPLALEKYRQPITAAIRAYGLQATLVEDPLLALAAADLAIAKSGTVNLEAALVNVPQVVIYRVNPIGLWLYQTFLKFKLQYASPVNLVEMQPIVPELLQDQATPDSIATVALELLLNPEARQQMQQGYQQMQQSLGEIGAVDRAAEAILECLRSI
ncbi:MAG: lipid-A-disaccharide synthase [Aphanocapsa sp. GSE-SYN-MK-11-07L]|jgi:lipid-A-disaccharide synthase|nr:lipid-A-disaccharide synthase [Aphanocapsa sp. GSE-SYN-MK-11-07L]